MADEITQATAGPRPAVKKDHEDRLTSDECQRLLAQLNLQHVADLPHGLVVHVRKPGAGDPKWEKMNEKLELLLWIADKREAGEC